MSTPVVVRCPVCSQKYRISATMAGQRARCKKCRAVFRIVAEAPIDDDTIVGWITNDDPGSQSVTGSTGLFEGMDNRAEKGEAAANGNIGAPTTCGVTLKDITESGAVFEFPAMAMTDERLRNSFSRKCVGCGVRANLFVHLLYWPERMIPNDPVSWKDHVDANVGRLDSYADFSDRTLLLQLPLTRHYTEPYTLPFPAFACPHCSVSREVEAHALGQGADEVCRLRIAYYPTAVSFFRNSGGRDTPDYYRLVEASDQRRDPWRLIDAPVRARIAKWYDAHSGEQFLAFYRDTDLPVEDSGTFGIVLTDHRLILRKYNAIREFPIKQPGRLECVKKGDHAVVHIYEEGHRPAVIHIDLVDIDNLTNGLQKLHCHWVVSR